MGEDLRRKSLKPCGVGYAYARNQEGGTVTRTVAMWEMSSPNTGGGWPKEDAVVLLPVGAVEQHGHRPSWVPPSGSLSCGRGATREKGEILVEASRPGDPPSSVSSVRNRDRGHVRTRKNRPHVHIYRRRR